MPHRCRCRRRRRRAGIARAPPPSRASPGRQRAADRAASPAHAGIPACRGTAPVLGTGAGRKGVWVLQGGCRRRQRVAAGAAAAAGRTHADPSVGLQMCDLESHAAAGCCYRALASCRDGTCWLRAQRGARDPGLTGSDYEVTEVQGASGTLGNGGRMLGVRERSGPGPLTAPCRCQLHSPLYPHICAAPWPCPQPKPRSSAVDHPPATALLEPGIPAASSLA